MQMAALGVAGTSDVPDDLTSIDVTSVAFPVITANEASTASAPTTTCISDMAWSLVRFSVVCLTATPCVPTSTAIQASNRHVDR